MGEEDEVSIRDIALMINAAMGMTTDIEVYIPLSWKLLLVKLSQISQYFSNFFPANSNFCVVGPSPHFPVAIRVFSAKYCIFTRFASFHL